VRQKGEALTAEKKVKGRQRHIVTDTQGHLLHVKSHPANEHDTIAGCLVFEEALDKYPFLQGVCADGGYRGTFADYVKLALNCLVDIVLKLPEGWTILPKRWVVERTFSWLNGSRRLSKDYEISTDSAESQVKLSHIHLLLRRLFHL
jgi:putative transposase